MTSTKTAAPSGVLILGATSAIAEAVGRRLAGQGIRLGLIARDRMKLDAVAADLKVRGAAAVGVRVLDLAEAPSSAALEGLAAEIGGADAVLIAYGWLGDQAEAEQDLDAAARILQVNFTSAALWALAAHQWLQRTAGRAGLIAAIGSVGGDRGRKSNFVYGAGKGGLAVLMQGLAHRSALTDGPRAVVFKLGFVDSPMTAAFPKGGPLWASPDQAAKVIVDGLAKPKAIIYGPWFWRWIILIIRLLPEAIFNKADI
jgi:short-subunit dehydrogenase